MQKLRLCLILSFAVPLAACGAITGANDGAGYSALLLQSWIPSLASAFSWNSVSWSISTEMFFYAMFPLMLALLTRNKAAFALVWPLPLPIVWLAALDESIAQW